jgi:hypothetical protein
MPTVFPLTEAGRQRIDSILVQASEDIGFRERLLEDPRSALADKGLTPDELEMLSSMRRVALEEWGVDVRRYRSFLRDNGNKVTPR